MTRGRGVPWADLQEYQGRASPASVRVEVPTMVASSRRPLGRQTCTRACACACACYMCMCMCMCMCSSRAPRGLIRAHRGSSEVRRPLGASLRSGGGLPGGARCPRRRVSSGSTRRPPSSRRSRPRTRAASAAASCRVRSRRRRQRASDLGRARAPDDAPRACKGRRVGREERERREAGGEAGVVGQGAKGRSGC